MQCDNRVGYASISIADIFREMNVDVADAEDYLEDLNRHFTASQKCVFMLIYGEGRTAVQAAEMLGVSPREVRTIHLQASQILRREWSALRMLSACGEGAAQ